MIITERITIGERELVRTYSDEGRYVVRDGVEYAEAIDPPDMGREYTEGDVMPEEMRLSDAGTATIEDYQAALTEMGVRLND